MYKLYFEFVKGVPRKLGLSNQVILLNKHFENDVLPQDGIIKLVNENISLGPHDDSNGIIGFGEVTKLSPNPFLPLLMYVLHMQGIVTLVDQAGKPVATPPINHLDLSCFISQFPQIPNQLIHNLGLNVDSSTFGSTLCIC